MPDDRWTVSAPPPFHRAGGYLRRASHAASFPLRGIGYFCRHREFHPLFAGRLLPLALISFIVYLILFTFAFLPQFAFLAIFHGWGAWVNAVVLVLGEGLVVTQGLFEGFFVDEARVDVFDATLIKTGYTDLVAPHRIVDATAPTAVRMLGKPTVAAAYQPWSIVQIVELIVCLPLNLVPLVGTPAFILITGSRLGRLSHYRWYKLRGLTRKERNAEISRRGWDYLWFGTVAMLLELVPVLSFFFLLTSAAGSALWAAELEGQRRQAEGLGDGRVVPGAGEGDGAIVAAEDEPPHYEDNPV
ncbi:uncharacterized protein SPSK_01881 [Sporothrix schenckii 1099-18]|uniref:Regulator of rDNA transcription protein 8 n=1 Tax=Sporothrix schenckii 1099-18 TaxID=1397361 RepID=A0A0F2MES2_SPOSC|nr:uncharacterized protein SPSK_01881 [Sporothrix schenckii 1099-18]KJR87569.1 hypothetical protein SPSK_01881 [Sporothrix schenckii 1099-18]